MPDFDESSTRLRDLNEPRIKRDPGKPNAARDGYTEIARRVRGDQPGYLTDTETADQIERMEDSGPMPVGYTGW